MQGAGKVVLATYTRGPVAPPSTVLQVDPAAVEASLKLTRSDRSPIQLGLNALKLDAGPADGLFGPNTRTAIRNWQEAKGFAATGRLSLTRMMPVTAPPGSRTTAQGLGSPFRWLGWVDGGSGGAARQGWSLRLGCQRRSKKGPRGGVKLGHWVLEACPRSPWEGPARAAACPSHG